MAGYERQRYSEPVLTGFTLGVTMLKQMRRALKRPSSLDPDSYQP
jgi:hypothetical protein